jgi:hypothetical protein
VVVAAVTNAVTSAASSVITLANCQFLTSALNNVAPVVLNGFYSILNCVYNKPNSTLVASSGTGGSTNSIDYFQYINADKFITQGGTSAQYVKGDGSLDSVSPVGPTGPTGPQGAAGATGATGASGVVAVTSPITNSGTSTSASLGFNATGFVKTSDTGTVTSTMIADGTIVNADISPSAAIGATKISGEAATLAAIQNVFQGSAFLGGQVSSIYVGRLQIKTFVDSESGDDFDYIDFFKSDGTLIGRIDGFGTFQLPRFSGAITTGQLTASDGNAAGNVTLAAGNVVLGTSTAAGGGVGVLKLTNRATAPATNPVAGGVLYTENGALKYKGSSGTVTTIATA